MRPSTGAHLHPMRPSTGAHLHPMRPSTGAHPYPVRPVYRCASPPDAPVYRCASLPDAPVYRCASLPDAPQLLEYKSDYKWIISSQVVCSQQKRNDCGYFGFHYVLRTTFYELFTSPFARYIIADMSLSNRRIMDI